MISHIFAIGSIQIARALIGFCFGAFLIFRSWNIPPDRLSRLEPGDTMVFLAAGVVSVALGILRGFQGTFTVLEVWTSKGRLGSRKWGWRRFLRRFSIAMAMVDLVDLTGFPITTVCGTYGAIVFRHPDSRDFFEGVFSEMGQRPRMEKDSA